METVALQKASMTSEKAPPVETLTLCAIASGVSLRFGGQQVLDRLDFTLGTGELVMLRGENGSGKTTLLNALSGYLRPDKGDIQLRLSDGWIDVTSIDPERLARQGVGRLWQDIRLFPTMTVLENVLAATPGLIGQNPLLAVVARPWVREQERIAHKQAMHNLSVVGMEHRADSSCNMLSVGQMKRVALARLLQMETKLILLDEPLAGLDSAAAEALVKDLAHLCTEHGKTILVVEHRYDRIEGIADRVCFLRKGKVVEVPS